MGDEPFLERSTAQLIRYLLHCRELKIGQGRFRSLRAQLQAEPSFQALQLIIRRSDPEVYAQLQWQEAIDRDWELVQRGDCVQQWLAHGLSQSQASPISQQHGVQAGEQPDLCCTTRHRDNG